MAIDRLQFNVHWLALRKRLGNKGITLSQLRSIEDEAMLLGSEENASLTQEILHQIHERRDTLLKESEEPSLENIRNILEKSVLCGSFEESEWEEKLSSLKNRLKGKREEKKIEEIEFRINEPLAHELDGNAIASTFASRMAHIAKRVKEQNSLAYYNKNLNLTQKKHIARISGENPNPEKLSEAVNLYVKALRKQMEVAQVFYFGRVKEGMEKLSKLSDEIRQRVDELIWQNASGEKQVSRETVMAALLHSVEEQMGMHEEIA